ncbi:hypothetical protein BC962_2025 [Gillisia mitskevichiae]|uniref:Ion channel n=1 Tax=Gillisia mitskevichiae TaxID=270921 RepID=A0A495PVG4_9FLAO|nr:potassium channel family protein [Gillisia mitskevichiae]RKS53770.1 hypothetical protein BC962_2025 [Gillisia mitskevichiae]
MNIALFILGLVITLVTIFDMISTILSPRGAGFIADRISRGIWRACLMACNRDGRKKFLNIVGPALLLIIVLTWILLLWFGNTFIVYSDAEALWSSSKNAYVTGFVEKMYFTAYVLSSMGNGDYTPGNGWWMIYTGFISYTGVVFISLGISFLIPVVDAITLKRQISLRIHQLGKTPSEIIKRYEENNFKELLQVLNELEPSLLKLAQQHLAYPVIHYFHSENLHESLSVKLVTLDETMSILLYSVDKENLSDIHALERAYGATTYYLSTLASAFIKPGDDEPKRPNTSNLKNVSKETSQRGTGHEEDLSKRRKLLLAYIQNDGWEWEDVEENTDSISLGF